MRTIFYETNILLRACALIAALSSPAAAKATYIEFNVSGAYSTWVAAINNAGVVCGSWSDAHNSHGFVRAADGIIASFDPPNAVNTYASNINDTGQSVGSFTDAQSVHHGFVRNADGTITVFDAPGAQGDTEIYAINKSGTFVGTYNGSDGNYHAFFDAAGVFTSFNLPGSTSTGAAAINDSGVITGGYFDSIDGVAAGFVRATDGTFATFAVQGSGDTVPRAINASGMVAGYYSDDNLLDHGFVRAADGTLTTFDVPGGTHDTTAFSINRKGVILGRYADGGPGEIHGFTLKPDGTFRSFNAPGGPKGYRETDPAGINDAGQIAGSYYNKKDRQRGFLRIP